jgi:predicted ABC-class ATPase
MPLAEPWANREKGNLSQTAPSESREATVEEPRPREALVRMLEGMEGKGYGAYKAIQGPWSYPDFGVRVDHVQGDPFAAPSRFRVFLSPEVAGLPGDLLLSPPRRVGAACFLARRFRNVARDLARDLAQDLGGSRGSGRSGEIRMEVPGQEVLPISAVRVDPDGAMEARFTVGLPARGRRVLGKAAARLLGDVLPRLVAESLVARALDLDALRLHAEANEDADALRDQLRDRGLLAFVADGASLPRLSGVDEAPMVGEQVVPFQSPPSLQVTLEAPNAGAISGMGLPWGVVLVVGGGYHGKSTLLRALERGVYNHRPGDGRERVVADPSAVKVRAEDGRSVAGVDISPFIGNLPGGEDTRAFSTPFASGSTSQAAGIMEALEAGATTLLVDEDTAATNFMIRDRRMQALVPRGEEPITPFIDRVRELHEDRGVSSVLVLGGSGDYLDVADTVVAMVGYRPIDVTPRAREVAAAHPTGRIPEPPGPMAPAPRRFPRRESLDPSRGHRAVRVRVRDDLGIQFGEEEIDLSAVDQIISKAQTRALSEGLLLMRREFLDRKGPLDVTELLDGVMELTATEGLDALGRGDEGDLAAFRRFELAAALNRLRSLAMD